MLQGAALMDDAETDAAEGVMGVMNTDGDDDHPHVIHSKSTGSPVGNNDDKAANRIDDNDDNSKACNVGSSNVTVSGEPSLVFVFILVDS